MVTSAKTVEEAKGYWVDVFHGNMTRKEFLALPVSVRLEAARADLGMARDQTVFTWEQTINDARANEQALAISMAEARHLELELIEAQRRKPKHG